VPVWTVSGGSSAPANGRADTFGGKQVVGRAPDLHVFLGASDGRARAHTATVTRGLLRERCRIAAMKDRG
jgi:hypothetical protein